MGLTVLTFVVKEQVRYVTQVGVRNSGENTLLVSLRRNEMRRAYPILKNELKTLPWVTQVSGSITIPPSDVYIAMSLNMEKGKDVLFNSIYADAGFAELMNLELKEGSFITGPDQGGGSPILINEKGAAQLNLKNVIGYKCGFGTIVGVVKDFPNKSAKYSPEPLLLFYSVDYIRNIAIKVNGNAPADCSKQLEKFIVSKMSDVVPTVTTLKEYVYKAYAEEIKQVKILSMVALISIFLAIMGLFGLSLFTLEQRTKEIGIRKISGASTSEILRLLFREYAWLVLAALVLAVPLSWFLLQKWLNTYAYHTAIHGWYYLVAALLALALVLLSILYQAPRVARRNPVESLKNE